MRVTTSVTTAARRAQVIASAIATIAELGYNRASFAQIAKRAGLSSTRLISYHFDDKTELIRGVVETVLAEAAAFMRPSLQAASGPRARLAAYIESNLAFIHTHPAHIRAVMDIAANARAEDGAANARAEDGAAIDATSAVALLEIGFRDGQAQGEFRAFDPRVMAVTVRAAIDAAADPLTGTSPADLHTYTAELIEIFDRATAATLTTTNEETS